MKFGNKRTCGTMRGGERPNDEFRMTKSERNPKSEARTFGRGGHGSAQGLRADRRRLRHARSAFTLAEVLAALAFMAIVIPVAIQGLRVAGQAGEVAMCKDQVARIADQIINKSIASTNWSTSRKNG